MRSEQTRRFHDIWTVSLVVLGVNAVLAALKIGGGFLFRSLSILGDGLDSLGDVLATASVLVASQWLRKPPDRDHPWGHDRADTLASKFLNFFMFFMGSQLLLQAIQDLMDGSTKSPPDSMGLGLLAANLATKAALSLALVRVAKRNDSQMLRANARNMGNDVLVSVAALSGVLLSNLLQSGFWDVVVAALVGLWIVAQSVLGFNETNLELMDGLDEPEVYTRVFNAVESVQGAFNPHRVRIRRFAGRYLIDLDVEMDGSLPLEAAHRVGCQIEQAIRRALPQTYDIMLHLEPLGNKEEDECFGLSRSQL